MLSIQLAMQQGEAEGEAEAESAVAWISQDDPDTMTQPLRIRPLRTLGVQVDTTGPHNPLDLFNYTFYQLQLRNSAPALINIPNPHS